MTAVQFLQDKGLESKFRNRNLATMKLEEVMELAKLTDTHLGELVVDYGFGASAIYVDDLVNALGEESPGTVLGLVAHVA